MPETPEPAPLRVYVAGPMTGRPDLNRPAHAAEAARLAALGHDPVSPAAEVDQTQSRRGCLLQAIGLLMSCDAISLLPGWEASTGTQAEVAMARALGLQVWLPETPETAMRPEDVPKVIVHAFKEAWFLHNVDLLADSEIRPALAAVLPAHEAEVRAKVAEELREDADAHRRLVARNPSEHDEARLARAKTLDDAAARVTRGEQP